MAEITSEDMGSAIQELLRARNRAVEALEMKDPDDPTKPFLPQTLPEPASTEALAELEGVIGVLPVSYRRFLEIHDGLPQADMGADLFSISAVLAFRSNEAERVFGRIKDEIEDRSADRLIFFGASDSRKNVFFFDNKAVDEFGEMSVIDHTDEEGIVDEYPSFLAFLQDLTATLDGIAEDYE